MENSYAIIKTGGKQLKVFPGQAIWVEKLNVKESTKYSFDQVIAISDSGTLSLGKPIISNAKVIGTVQKNGKGPKLTIFRTKAKSNWSRKQGHRQPYTRIMIDEIIFGSKSIKSLDLNNDIDLARVNIKKALKEEGKKNSQDQPQKNQEPKPQVVKKEESKEKETQNK